MIKKKSVRSFSISDDIFYNLEQIAVLRGDTNVTPLATEILDAANLVKKKNEL